MVDVIESLVYVLSISVLSALDMKAMTEDVKNWMEKQKQQDSVEQSVLLVEGYTIFNYE